MPWTGKSWADGARNQTAPGSHYTADSNITASDSTNAARLAGEGFVAVPTSAWTEGQAMYVGGFAFYWTGSAWAAGAAGAAPAGPTPGPQTPSNRWVVKNTAYSSTESVTTTGAVSGRLLVATIAARSTAGAPITPAGWTSVGALLGGSGTSSPTLQMWARVSAGVETAAFWDGTFDANKCLVVEEWPVTLASGLTVIGGTTNDSGAATGAACPMTPAAVTPSRVLYLASVAVRDVVTAMSQSQSGWNIPGYWDSNTVVDTPNNVLEAHTNAVFTATSTEPAFNATWTTAQRFRGRIIGFEVT